MNHLKDPPVVSHAWQFNSKQKVRSPFDIVFFYVYSRGNAGKNRDSKQKEIGLGLIFKKGKDKIIIN